LGALVSLSVQVMLGVQLMLPLWQTLVGVQGLFRMHEVHVPVSQTMLVPHDVPFGTVPVELHTETPVEHEVTPVSHGLLGVHETPAEQALQVPLSQTWLLPQVVPFETLVPVSVHAGTPVEHAVVPVWQTLVGVQAAPTVHALHDPLSHTWLVPHVVPLAALLPVSAQTDTPVEHDVAPVWHGLLGVHVTPAVHALHVPLSHTWLEPQVVPFARLLPVSLHTDTPVEHDVVPE
jgi:hypothetical protein